MIAPHTNDDGTSQPSKTPSASNCHGFSPSISSELTVTPQRLHHQPSLRSPYNDIVPTRLAGIVGILTGCGALLALGLFLRLPELVQRRGTSPGQALADTYYIVGTMSLVLGLLCFLGLRNLHGEDEKEWRNLVYGGSDDPPSKVSSLRSFVDAVALGFKNHLIGLGYLGGFVARASVRLFAVLSSSTLQTVFLSVPLFELRDSWYPLDSSLNPDSLSLERNADSETCSRLRSRSSFPSS